MLEIGAKIIGIMTLSIMTLSRSANKMRHLA